MKLHSRRCAIIALPQFLACLLALNTTRGEEETPEVRVSNVRRVLHNGEHNAFTDLVRFHDRFYLAFRSCPDGHGVHPTSSIIILASEDTQTWKPVHRFRVPKRDTRDPHFLVFKDKLFVYTGTWYCGDSSPKSYEYNQHLGYAVWSEDGRKWSKPTMLEGTYGHYIWRAATHDGTAFLCGRRKREFVETPRSVRSDVESAMLESDDGLIWRTRSLFQTTLGNETGFLFEPDGSVLAVSRFTQDNSQLSRSQPPYDKWQRTDLHRYLGGPLLTRWGARYLVGGRKNTEWQPKTALYWLVDGKLQECAELTSAGDNSYPGFIELSPTRGLVSWYSSHEKDDSGKMITAIYLAELSLNMGDPEENTWTSLFNGKDLTGWHRQQERGQHGTGGHWGVTANGVLFGEQDPPGSGNGGLLLSDQTYSEFELEVSLRPDWGPDSGVFIRTDERGGGWQVYVDHHDHGNVGHVRLETKPYSVPFRPWGFSRIDPAQVDLEMAVDGRTANWPAGVYEESCTQEQWLRVWKPEDWNRLRIRCTGGDLPVIETWVNGLKVCRFNAATTTHPKFQRDRALRVVQPTGAIGLQVHGGKNWQAGDRVYWKDLRIRKIAP